MTKQKKLDAIYEAMADKTLSQWCKVFYWEDLIVGDVVLTFDDELAYRPVIESIIEPEVYEIIWHPVRIWDVLDYWDTIAYLYPERTEYTILYKWGNKRLPIDEQSDDAISFVYNLIKK